MKNHARLAAAVLVAPFVVSAALGACSSDGGSSSGGSSGSSGGAEAGVIQGGPPPPAVTGSGEQAKVTVAGPAAPVHLVQGTSVEIEVSITRGGSTGGVQVSIADLPAKVIATAETIPVGMTTAKLKLVAESSADQIVARPKIVATAVGTTVRAEAPFDFVVRGPAGSIDTTFGTGGRVPFAATAILRGVYATKDGKLLAWGGDGTDPVLARYIPDGALDATFGTAGKYKRSNTLGPGPTVYEAATQLADGRLMLLTTRGSGPSGYRPVLTRLGVDGAYDTGFGEQTLTTTVGFGTSFRKDASGRTAVVFLNGQQFMRLLEIDGTPATNAQIGCGEELSGGALALASTTEGYCYMPVAPGPVERRTLATGAAVATSADLPFDMGYDVSYPGRTVLVAGGRVYVAGMVGASAAIVAHKPNDLALDTTFGTNGRADSFAGSRLLFAIPGPSGAVVVAGHTASGTVLARHLADGTLDPGFGAAGVVTLPTDGQTGLELRGITTMADGRVVVAIASQDQNQGRLLRIWP